MLIITSMKRFQNLEIENKNIKGGKIYILCNILL